MKPKHGNLSATEGINPFHVLINTANVTSLKSADIVGNRTVTSPIVKGK